VSGVTQRRVLNDSLIANHITLGYARADENQEVDCGKNNAYHGVWAGSDIDGAQYEKEGKRLYCGKFNGTDNRVESTAFPNSALTGGFTLCAWVNPDATSAATNHRIMDKSNGTSGNNGFYLLYNASSQNVSLTVNAGTARASSNNSVIKDTWTHVAVTVAADATVTIYVNSVASGTEGTTGALSGIVTTNPFAIGRRSNSNDRYFKGLLDECMVFNKVLTTDEIQWIMDKKLYSGQSLYDDHCEAWWSFDNPKAGDRRSEWS
jgi:hypothetical protein